MRHFIFILIAVCFLLNDAAAQNQKAVDSLQAVLETKTGADRYSPLYELTFEYLDKDNDKALQFVEEAEKAALLSGDSLWIVKSKRVRGQVLRKLERTGESIPLLESALGIACREHFEKERMYISSALGLSHLFHGHFDRALKRLDQSLQVARSEGDTSLINLNLMNIGVVYYKLHNYEKAISYFLQHGEFSSVSSLSNWRLYVNLSLCYSNLEDFEMAEMYLMKGYGECRGNCTDEANMHLALVAGHIFHNSEQYGKALPQLQRSLALAKKIGDVRIMLDDIFMIAEVLIKKNKLKTAATYLNQGENLIETGAPYPQTIVEVYARFCHLYKKIGDYKKLAFYQSKYITLKDSIYNYDLTTQLMATESGLRERENMAKIAAQQEVLALKEDVIDHQRTLNVVSVVLGFMTLLFAIYAFRNVRSKKKLNILLEQKICERTRELELSRDELLKSLREMNLRAERVSGFVNDAVNRIEGLCCTALQEIRDTTTFNYLQRINATVDAIRRLFPPREFQEGVGLLPARDQD